MSWFKSAVRQTYKPAKTCPDLFIQISQLAPVSFRSVVLWGSCLAVLVVSFALKAKESFQFSVPGGQAIKTLKIAAKQGDIDLMFQPQTVDSVITASLEGEFTVEHAFQKLLANTGLELFEDSQSKTYAIIVSDAGLYPQAPQSEPVKPKKSTNTETMKKESSNFRTIFAGIVGILLASSTHGQESDADDRENIFEMSPFIVTTTEDVGYQATSTLAGTRIRTNLKDLGSSISVVTTEFLEDTAATGMGTLLSYVGNAEVGGVMGNFSGAEDVDDGRFIQNGARTNPQFNQRIRGLGNAALTRSFFLTDIPLDSYNTERVTINRGPNSLLFGIGSPGGVINNTVKRAIMNSDFAEIKVRLDNFGSFRTELDVNRSIIEDRFTIRIAGLYDDTEFKQDPAWNRDERFYGTAEWVIFENEGSNFLDRTVLRVNGETGVSKGSPPEVIPPSVAYHNWFEPISPNIEQFTGSAPFPQAIAPADGGRWEYQATYNPFEINSDRFINTTVRPAVFRHVMGIYGNNQPGIGNNNGEGFLGLIPWNAGRDSLDSAGLTGTPGVAGLPGSTGLNRLVWYHANSPYGEPYAIGFAVPTLQDRRVFDYHNNIYSGGIDIAEREFDAINFSLEQGFFDNRAGIEISYDKQHYESTRDFFFAGGNGTSRTGPYDIYVDIAEYLPNGQVNPNLGRAYSRVARPEIRYDETDRETFRITAFGELDFSDNDNFLRHLGRHRFTALYNSHTRDTFSRRHMEAWNSNSIDIASIVAGSTIDHFRRPVNIGVYVSDSLLGLNSIDDVRINQINIRRPQPGDSFNVIFGDAGKSAPADRAVMTGPVQVERYLNSEGIGRTTIDATAFAWQSYLFDEHIVGLLGWREDSTESFGQATTAEVGFGRDNEDGSYNPDFTQLASEPFLDQSGETVTWSIVARYPEVLLGDLPWGADLQFHYAESENFNPVGLRSDVLGRPIDQPTGTTKEYGFLLSLDEGKYSIKFNWFETALEGIDAGVRVNVLSSAGESFGSYLAAFNEGIPFSNALALVDNPAGHPIQSYEQFFDALTGIIPAEVLAATNPVFSDTDGNGIVDEWSQQDPIQNLRSTRDRVAKGFEVEAVANPKDNWRILLNISKQETTNSNTAGTMASVAEQYNRDLFASRLNELVSDPTGEGQLRPISDRWLTSFLAPVRQVAALDGTVSNEQREWRVVGVTNYEFKEGKIRGTSVGGAVRWESEAATGYVFALEEESGVPVPLVDQPFFDDGLLSGDLWIGYERPLFDGKVDWKIQLNIRNAIGESDDIPVRTNPDGQVAVVRIPNPRTFYLTNTFRF